MHYLIVWPQDHWSHEKLPSCAILLFLLIAPSSITTVYLILIWESYVVHDENRQKDPNSWIDAMLACKSLTYFGVVCYDWKKTDYNCNSDMDTMEDFGMTGDIPINCKPLPKWPLVDCLKRYIGIYVLSFSKHGLPLNRERRYNDSWYLVIILIVGGGISRRQHHLSFPSLFG